MRRKKKSENALLVRKRDYTAKEFKKAFGDEWEAFKHAYIDPANAVARLPLVDEVRELLSNTLLGEHVYESTNKLPDTKLLHELAFSEDSFPEFLEKHLRRPIRLHGPLPPITDGRDEHGKRYPSPWRDNPRYKDLLTDVSSAARALSNYCVSVDNTLRVERSPMLHAIEDALITKWMQYRNHELENHPYMKGRPLFDSTRNHLKGTLQQEMRGEIAGETAGFFAHQLLWSMFGTKCRTAVMSGIPEFCRKAKLSTLRHVTAGEAVEYLLAAYYEKFTATLYTYMIAAEGSTHIGRASFASLLSDNAATGLVTSALRIFAAECGINYNDQQSIGSMAARTALSTEHVLGTGDDAESFVLGDTLEAKSTEPAMHKDELQKIEGAVSTLTERERDVIERRYGLNGYIEPHTLEEVGRAYDVTRERIRQIESKALKKLREKLYDFRCPEESSGRGR